MSTTACRDRVSTTVPMRPNRGPPLTRPWYWMTWPGTRLTELNGRLTTGSTGIPGIGICEILRSSGAVVMAFCPLYRSIVRSKNSLEQNACTVNAFWSRIFDGLGMALLFITMV